MQIMVVGSQGEIDIFELLYMSREHTRPLVCPHHVKQAREENVVLMNPDFLSWGDWGGCSDWDYGWRRDQISIVKSWKWDVLWHGRETHASVLAEHNNHFPQANPTMKRRHCRKEIMRKHQRDFPAIRAAMRQQAK